MRRYVGILMIVGLISVLAAGCASNRAPAEEALKTAEDAIICGGKGHGDEAEGGGGSRHPRTASARCAEELNAVARRARGDLESVWCREGESNPHVLADTRF